MAETEKQEDPASRGSTRKISRFIGRIQRGLSRLLLWLASLLRAPHARKEAAARFLRGAGTYMSNMSPTRFVCCMIAIAAIVISIIFFIIPSKRKTEDYISRPIALWFSEMGDGSDLNYLSIDTCEAIKMIENGLDIFEVRVCEPSESDPTSDDIVLNAIVGCYKASGHSNTKELRIQITELEGDELLEPYETLSEFPSDQIIQRIRERVFEAYPPRGTIYDLQPKEDEPAKERESHRRKIYLDIGSLMGVREGDMFDILVSDKIGSSRNNIRIKILESSLMRSVALVPWDKEIEEGDGVEWVKDE